MNKKRLSNLYLLIRKGQLFFILMGFMAMISPSSVLADKTGEYLPQNILGMELQKVISGEEAAKIINRMHQGDVATHSDYIAEYKGNAGSATYYLSLYESPCQAAQAMKDMARVMKKQGHGFSHFMQRTHKNISFYMALGQGQAHYFYANGIWLVWLAVDKAVAEQAIMELLQKTTDQVDSE